MFREDTSYLLPGFATVLSDLILSENISMYDTLVSDIYTYEKYHQKMIKTQKFKFCCCQYLKMWMIYCQVLKRERFCVISFFQKISIHPTHDILPHHWLYHSRLYLWQPSTLLMISLHIIDGITPSYWCVPSILLSIPHSSEMILTLLRDVLHTTTHAQ